MACYHNDLTALTGIPPTHSGSQYDGYQTTFNNQQHVNFIRNDSHIHESYFDGAWHHKDLTLLTGAPGAVGGIPL